MTKATEKQPIKKTAKAASLEQIDFSSDREMLTSQEAAPENRGQADERTPEPTPPAVSGVDIARGIDMLSTTILLSVRGCSACGGDHDGVILLPLTSPALDLTHTHFFNCPTTGQSVTIQHLAG